MPGRKKHLIVIHGRATKPSASEKKSLVKKSLLHGIDRVDSTIATKIKNGNIKYSFVYYGDVSNQELIARDKDLKKSLTGKNDVKYNNEPCEPKGSYDDDLETMLAQELFTKAAYKKLLADVPDKRYLDEIAAFVSWFSSKTGFSDEIISRATADMGAYLLTRKVGSEVRERLGEPLKKALLADEDVCLVSHSMGCIVSYDVLWKFSQMSEYRDVQHSGNKINLWLTIGNPLGEPGVKKNLYDANEKQDGKYPKHIINDWLNISAVDDFVSHDCKIADDYAEMKTLGYLNKLKDMAEIYNFWSGTNGSNPHKFYSYLDNPNVAKTITQWAKRL
jgi:hypothetical protein